MAFFEPGASEVNLMYEEFLGHFRLERNPFSISLSQQVFYSTAAHDEALLQLVFGAETRQGLMVLTGEPGTGKTTILRYFREWLQQRCNYSTAYLFHPSLPSIDLLRLISRDFGIPHDTPSKGDLLIALTDWLTERQRARDCPVVLIDEAQALTSTALEELRMLLNLEVDEVKLVQIVLAGQPLLEEKLRLPQMAQLRQRIMCHFQLLPFTPEETAGYIARRLAWAGSEDPCLFPQETVREIFKYSNGIPRVINLICEYALLSCFADRRVSVDLNDVVAVAQDFELGGQTRNRNGLSRTNIFCRLIPFPELSVKDVKLKSKQGAEETATTANIFPIEQEKESATLGVASDFAVVEPMNYNDNLEPEENAFADEKKMWETAQLLIDIAIKSQMKIFDVDQETARGWVARAADVEVKSKQGAEETTTTANIFPIEQEKESATLGVASDFAVGDPICAPSAGVSASRLESIISKTKSAASQLCSHFLLNRHAVVSSFARAGRHFVGQCMEWLNKPMGMASVEAPTLHRLARSLHSWLLRPIRF